MRQLLTVLSLASTLVVIGCGASHDGAPAVQQGGHFADASFCLLPDSPDGQLFAEGLAGGYGGVPKPLEPPAVAEKVSEVRVWAGRYIDAVQMVYRLPNGTTRAGPKIGAENGRPPGVITLASGEFIVGVSGRCGANIDSVVNARRY